MSSSTSRNNAIASTQVRYIFLVSGVFSGCASCVLTPYNILKSYNIDVCDMTVVCYGRLYIYIILITKSVNNIVLLVLLSINKNNDKLINYF